jgi:hypothetical protein
MISQYARRRSYGVGAGKEGDLWTGSGYRRHSKGRSLGVSKGLVALICYSATAKTAFLGGL